MGGIAMLRSSSLPISLIARFGTFAALRDPTFRRIWSIGIFYYTYRSTEIAVLSWFVLTLTDSELQVAIVGASRIAPMFLFGLIAGGLSDRFPRQWLMRGGQTVNFVAACVMVMLLTQGWAQSWHAFAMIFITGTSWAVDYAARRALIADIFRGGALTNAVALDSGLVTGTNMIGPLLGTFLVRHTDFSGAYVGIALMMAAALALALSMRVRVRQTRAVGKGSAARQIADAALIMRRNRTVLGAVLVTASFNFFGWPFIQMVPVIARDVLGLGEVHYGLLLSALGAGALVGSAAIASWRPSNKGNVYTWGSGLLMAAAAAYAWAPWYELALPLMFVAGLGLSAFATMQPVIPMEAVAAEERGRAMGGIVLGIGFQAPGMFLMGLIGELVGPREGVTYVALAGIVSIVLLRRIFPALADRETLP